jgi:uncharacterized protein
MCGYCYYINTKPEGITSGLDNSNLLEKYISDHIEASGDQVIFFSWHGGEPLLAGIEFYRKVINIQKKYLPEGKKILNGIQTNGTLLNEEWCRFFAEEKFTIGISIDGPEKIHNANRRSADDKPSFARVLKGYDQLKKHGINPEILCVVSAVNQEHPAEVYNLFRRMEAEFVTFLPLVERRADLPKGVSALSVDPLKFGNFLCSVFDEWTEKDIGNIKVQIFEEMARTAFRQDHTLCVFKENCGGVPVLERNGNVYSCDHFVDSHHLIGNIQDFTIAELLDSPVQKKFGLSKSKTLPQYCHRCEVKQMCNGECPKNRFMCTPDGEPGLNYLCPGYKLLFNHCLPFVTAISNLWNSSSL